VGTSKVEIGGFANYEPAKTDEFEKFDCARHFGARAVAVGTGQMYSNEEVLKHNPDKFLPDLSDPDLVLKTVAEL